MHRIIFRGILLLSGAAVTANAVIAAALSNMHAGIWLTFLAGGFLLTWGALYPAVRRRVPGFVRGGITLCIAVAAVCVLSLFLYGRADTVTYTEDAVIVLGAGIRGERLSENLQNRLDRAVAYHTENPSAVIVVSGGQGPGEDITEALAMERYLLEQGIPPEKILREEAATSTEENFRFSQSLLEADADVAFITADYHIYRAQQIAEGMDFATVTHCRSTTPWYMILPCGLRECLAVVKLWITGGITG